MAPTGWSPRTRRSAASMLLAVLLGGLAVLSYASVPTVAASAPSPHGDGANPVGVPATASTTPPSTAGTRGTPSLGARVDFQVPGIHPASWHGATPPGAPVPSGWGGGPNGSNLSDLWARCFGVWPDYGGQGTYGAGCYGHDEPGIDPYSTLTGSGGNVSWNVTLPVDRSPTENQSNLYTAIWFGLTLDDPSSWLNQCFLELQFYPDSSWTVSGADNGNWVGAAVAWQIDPQNGLSEDACYYQVLTVTGNPSEYFDMTQGDTINVTMSGWVGDPNGENLTITDVTTGVSSTQTLRDLYTGAPLDPAYVTSGWPNSLLWTPGGETPVSFAFETGHSDPEFPNTNEYGGCSPGAPPPSSENPAVPCPSYDPGYWENDTLTPWEIHAPTFFNATERQTATQVGFTQDLGALDFIDANSSGGSSSWTCLGRETSAYCSYPWYSYSCATHAFNFGATDYPTTTDDFGKDRQYRGVLTADASGAGYYPPSNQSIPACGTAGSPVTVQDSPSTLGNVTFLNRTVAGGGSGSTFSAVTPGNYSIQATPAAGAAFGYWSTFGNVSVADTYAPKTNLEVTGLGTVNAIFVARASVVDDNVTFGGGPTVANITVIPGAAWTPFGSEPSPGLETVGTGTTLHLAPGLYSIQADAPPGFLFSSWHVVRGDVTLSTPTTPLTVVDVAAGGNATVNATFAASSATGSVEIATYGIDGTATLNGTSYPGGGFATLPVGTYPISIAPSPGVQFETWSYEGSVLTNFSATSELTVTPGTSALVPVGFEVFNVTLDDAGGNGTVAWNTASNATAVAVANGTVVSSTSYGAGDAVYSLTAVPPAGEEFSGWSSNNTTFAWINGTAPSPVGSVVLNLTLGVPNLTITAHFAAAVGTNVSYTTWPSGAGALAVGYAALRTTSGTVGISTSGSGVYVVAFPNGGWVVAGLATTNVSGLVEQSSAADTLPWQPWVWYVLGASGIASFNVTFRALAWPVTFAADSPTGSPSATVNGTSLGVDDTLWLANGTYSLSATLSSGVTFLNWTTSWARLVVANPSLTSTTVQVRGPGTIYLLDSSTSGPAVVGAAITPPSDTLLPGGSVVLNASIQCAGGHACPSGATLNWSLSSSRDGSLNTSSGPSVRFTALTVSATVDVNLTASLHGATVETSAVLAIMPELESTSLSPAAANLYSGTSVTLGVSTGCSDALPCPAGTSYVWTDNDPSLGALISLGPNASFPDTERFIANAGVVGDENVTVQVTLGNQTLAATSALAIVAPALTVLTVSPHPSAVRTGSVTNFSAVPACTYDLACPSGTQVAWTLAPSSLGALNTTTGPDVNWTAGATNASGWLNASATLDGVTVDAAAVPLVVVAVPVRLTGITVTPGSASVDVGDAVTFTAALTCQPVACPSGIPIAWSVAPDVGVLNATSGRSVTLTARIAGTATVYANASWNGTTVHADASPVTVGSTSPGTTTSSTPLLDNPLLWVGIVVLIVVAVAAAFLWRRRAAPSDGPSATPPPK